MGADPFRLSFCSPSEYIIREHYRLGSGFVILSRSFCDVQKVRDIGTINAMFLAGIRKIRALEEECENHARFFRENRQELKNKVSEICRLQSGK